VNDILEQTADALSFMIEGFRDEKLKDLKRARKTVQEINQESKLLKNGISQAILGLRENALDAGPYYVQVVDYLREVTHSANFMIEPVYQHISNNHKGLSDEQAVELTHLHKDVRILIDRIKSCMLKGEYEEVSALIERQGALLQEIQGLRKKQVKRIKEDKATTKGSVIYLDLLSESKNLLLYTVNILKSMRDLHQALRS